MIQSKELKYVSWQNRATRFYLASRLLTFKELWAPAVFCGQQAIETLLKAALIYWDNSFRPIKVGHSFPEMIRIMKNKVPNSANVNIPGYFYWDGRYQMVSRYPSNKGGFLVPGNFLNDLDKIFYDLIVLVPFQFNSELNNIIRCGDMPGLDILRKKNKQVRKLRKFLA